MDCYRDTCMTTEKCRCYALIGKGDSKSNQVCAHKRGDRYFLCEASCCKGGCPGQCSGVLSHRIHVSLFSITPSLLSYTVPSPDSLELVISQDAIDSISSADRRSNSIWLAESVIFCNIFFCLKVNYLLNNLIKSLL